MTRFSNYLVYLFMLLFISTEAQERKPEGFVNGVEVIPGVALEIRYATTDNFLGRRVVGYKQPIFIITNVAAEALAKVQHDLQMRGLGLKIFDAYRPQKAVDRFLIWASDVDDTLTKSKYYPEIPKVKLFDLGYIAKRSSHTRGSTVDLTLIDLLTGRELDMGSGFDFFGPISHHNSTLISPHQAANRVLLRDAMRRHGFKSYAKEWWHYTLADEPFPSTYFDFDVE